METKTNRPVGEKMTLRDNPLTVSIGFIVCVLLFMPVFIQVGIEIWRKR